MPPRRGSWCVLRVGGSRTLPLYRSLAAAGMDVWTPTFMISKRHGRSRAMVETEATIMPTFVFVRMPHLEELISLEHSFISPHPQFSIFRYNGRIVSVSEHELAPLRTEEGRAALSRKRKERHVFKPGQSVCVPDGPFAGMSGVVEDSGNGKLALVCFGEWRVKIATFLLKDERVDEDLQHNDAAPIERH